jgi:hypothetical protein
MPKSTTSVNPDETMTVLTPATPLALVKAIIADIPQADEDPTERMTAFILSQPPEEWDRLWAGVPNVRDNDGRKLRVWAIRARESDFEGPLGLYLIADVTWLDTGERGLLSCSSQMSMIQLLVLHREGRLPADIQIIRKEKATKSGFHPVHLRYLGAVNAALGDPGAVVSEQ